MADNQTSGTTCEQAMTYYQHHHIIPGLHSLIADVFILKLSLGSVLPDVTRVL